MKEQSVLAYCKVGWTVFSSDNSTGVEYSKYSLGSRIEVPKSISTAAHPISSFMADRKPKSTRLKFRYQRSGED